MRLTKIQGMGLLLSFILLVSCSGDGKRGHRSDFLQPIEIEVPESIKNDSELNALVEESEKAMNEFSDNLEYLIEDIKPYKDMKEDDFSTFDKMKIAKIGVEFLTNSANGMAVLEKINNYATQRAEQDKPLTDEQIKAMAVIYDTFEARMKALEDKYHDFAGKNNQ